MIKLLHTLSGNAFFCSSLVWVWYLMLLLICLLILFWYSIRLTICHCFVFFSFSFSHSVSIANELCIGNGPSGITLSYMLAGNWPYWNPQDITKHPDELLRARLSFADSNESLVQQDLVQLAEGLEGRSTNPVSLLVSARNDIWLHFNWPCVYHHHHTHKCAHTFLMQFQLLIDLLW